MTSHSALRHIPGLKVDPASLFDLSGANVVVVGAGGGGLGTETARLLAAFGAHLLCADINPQQAEEVAAECGGHPFVADVTDESQVVEMLGAAESQLGQIDAVVDVVGYSTMSSAAEVTGAEWDREFDLNLRHAFYVGRHAAPRMARGGSITFFGSVASLYGMSSAPAYSASKAALNGWMRSLAQEYGPSGIRVNNVLPGPTWSPRNRSRWSASTIASIEQASMLRRIGDEHEIASAVLFLTSRAASNITGQCLVVDGGAGQRDPYFDRA